MKIDFGMGEQEIVVSLYTLVVYENEFHSDMIQDVFGRMAVKRDEKADNELFVMDFRDTNWFSLSKALWAALKTADDSVKPYREWSAEVDSFNMYELASTFLPELQRRLFRTGAADSE